MSDVDKDLMDEAGLRVLVLLDITIDVDSPLEEEEDLMWRCDRSLLTLNRIAGRITAKGLFCTLSSGNLTVGTLNSIPE